MLLWARYTIGYSFDVALSREGGDGLEQLAEKQNFREVKRLLSLVLPNQDQERFSASATRAAISC